VIAKKNAGKYDRQEVYNDEKHPNRFNMVLKLRGF